MSVKLITKYLFIYGGPMIKRIEHVGVMVSDMNKSINFYENLLGFKLRIRVINSQKEIAFLTHDGLPGFEIELLHDLSTSTSYSEYGLVNHLAFITSNIDKMIREYKQKGIIFETDEPKRGINGRKTIRFRGPNKEMLQLVEERI
ncbi:VOC family protein [Priestia aryabhattai]|uniref:VOC family protein n=2 Tax=Priestia aryabhattai TaxID=412384 RepID=UPI003CF668D6